MLMSRKYTVDEIMLMRECIRSMYPPHYSYRPDERAADIERRLTTYMANGTTAEELQVACIAYLERQYPRYLVDSETGEVSP